MGPEELEAVATAVTALDEKTVLALVRDAIDGGVSSVEITRAVERGMRSVGERYERHDVFLSGLIMAGEIFRSVARLTQPGLEHEWTGDTQGKVILGTVSGDIHDIGKNMAFLAFRSFGFSVRDLGVNVPAERFLQEARDFSADIVGLSGLLTGAFTSMRDTVGMFRENAADLPEAPVLIIGGCTIDEQVAQYVDADFWSTDAMEGVRICQRIMEERRFDGE